MKNNYSIMLLGYSQKLSGGVSKVTGTLLNNIEELELHPVLICYRPIWKSIFYTILYFFLFLMKLTLHIDKYKIIIVIVGSGGDVIRTLPFIWYSFILRKKICIQYHKSADILLKGFQPGYLLKLVLFTWNHVSLHCHLSSSLESLHRNITKCTNNNTVIPNAIDNKWLEVKPLDFSGRNREIVFFGRWSWEKGVHDLTAAMGKITHHAVCEIYSNAPANLDFKNCRLSPWVGEDEVYEIMKSARLLILPSYAEAYPTVLLEAVACRTPFIASNIAGIPDIANESKCGMLFEPGDVDDLARKIDHILTHRSVWYNLSINSTNWIITHSIDNIMAKWRYQFSRLLAE